VNAPADTPRFRRGPVVFSLALIGEFACLLWALKAGDLSIAGHPARLVGSLLGAGVCFLVAVQFLAKGSTPGRAVFFWFVAIALRVVLLPMAPGDDLWRYQWEGRIQHHGFNPYVENPDSQRLVAWRDHSWAKINHRESAAIYPPATELLFAALASATTAPSVLVFKTVFVLADLATVALLLALIGGPDRHRTTAWYAWNPAVAYACAGAGHFDSLMLLPITAAVLALRRAVEERAPSLPRPAIHGTDRAVPSSRHPWSWSLISTACLGLAIAFKLIPIFLLPVWFFALRRRAAVLLLAIAIPAGLSIPYGGPAVVVQPLFAFAEVTRFNDLVWGWIEAVTIPNPLGRNWPFTLALALAVIVIPWKLRDDWRRSAFWVLGAALLLSPVLHPWYVIWILPLAVWRGQIAWTVLSLSALTALLLWETTPLWTAWQPNLLTRSMVVLPPLAAWLVQSKIENRKSKIA